MARHLGVEYEGAIYQVTCRMLGDAGSILFTDDVEFIVILKASPRCIGGSDFLNAEGFCEL